MIFELANPKRFLDFSAKLIPWFAATAGICLVVGFYWALFASPEDEEMYDTVRILYVHVPAAWMSMFCYGFLAGASIFGLVWKHPVADMAAKGSAPIGAAFTALALATGSLWGKPMWGTWWEWDARMTSVLVQFFMYVGYMSLWRAIEDPFRAARAAAILAIVGAINLPIIKFSVDWWNTLHQPASVFRAGGSRIDPSMLWPLAIMAIGYTMLFSAVVLVRIRTEILKRRERALMLARVRQGG